MPTLQVRKGTQHYEVHGPEGAPWVVLLPGAFASPWQYEPARLALAKEFRVLEPTYRGTGESRNFLWDVTPPQIAEDLLALLDHLRIGTLHALAVSYGVFVLAEMLHRDPRRFGRCAIGGMPALRDRFSIPNLKPEDLAGFPDDAKPMHRVVLGLVPVFVSPRFRAEQPERYQAMLQRMLDAQAQDAWAGLKQFYGIFSYPWGRMRVFEDLPRERRLFLTGEDDLLAPFPAAREHPLLAAGPTVVFRGAGHRFFFEDADPFNEVVAGFLRGDGLPGALPGGGRLAALEAMP